MKRGAVGLALACLVATPCPAVRLTQGPGLPATAAAPAAAPPAKAGVSDVSTQRIGSVVDTLKDLLASIVTEEQQETANYNGAKAWCDQEIASKQTQIDNDEVSLDDTQVMEKQMAAQASTISYTLDENKGGREDLTDALAQAKSIREEENSKYEEEKTANMQSLSQLTTAINILQKVHATDAAGGFLETAQAKAVKAQLKEAEPGDSGFILGMFKQLKKTMLENQEAADEAESKQQALYDKLVATKQGQLSEAQDEWQNKRIALTETETKQTEATRDISDLQARLAETKDYLKETTLACAEKEKEWKLRSEDRAKEKEAITQAIGVLEIAVKDGMAAPGAPAFVQVASSTRLAGALVSTASAELAALSTADDDARQGVFDSLKAVITKLIDILLSDQKGETEKRDWCKTEIAKKKSEQGDMQDSLDLLNATIDRKSTEVESLTQEVDSINAAIADSKQRDLQAADLRSAAKTTYEAGKKDRMLALKVLYEAHRILSEFYATQDPHKTGLLQKTKGGHQRQRPETFHASSRHGGAADGVLALLEKISQDIQRDQQDAEVEENEAAAAWAKHLVASREEFDTRMEEITMRVTRKAKLLVQLDYHKETLGQQVEALDAVTQQLSGLATECTQLLENHDAREKARAFEVSQLRDVIDILSGSSEAVRTGLLQLQEAGGSQDPEYLSLLGLSQAIATLQQRAQDLAR